MTYLEFRQAVIMDVCRGSRNAAALNDACYEHEDWIRGAYEAAQQYATSGADDAEHAFEYEISRASASLSML